MRRSVGSRRRKMSKNLPETVGGMSEDLSKAAGGRQRVST